MINKVIIIGMFGGLTFIFWFYLSKESLQIDTKVNSNSNSNSLSRPKMPRSPNNTVSSNENSNRPIAEVKNSTTTDFTLNIPIDKSNAFPQIPSKLLVVEELSNSEKESFRNLNSEVQDMSKVADLGLTNGAPQEVVGPITIQTLANKAIYLRAIDKGLFPNGQHDFA